MAASPMDSVPGKPGGFPCFAGTRVQQVCRHGVLALLILAALFSTTAFARENRVAGAPGPAGEPAKEAPARVRLGADDAGLRIELPPASAREKNAAVPPEQGVGPLRIGFHRDVPKAYQGDVLSRLVWKAMGDGTLAAVLLVSSPQATSIRVAVRAKLPPGGALRFFHPAGDERNVLIDPVVTAEELRLRAKVPAAPQSSGASQSAGAAKQSEVFWSPSVTGDAIGVEITLPSGVARESAWLRVEKIAHRYADANIPRNTAQCAGHIDVQCRASEFPAELENAVARIEYEDGVGTALCTGQLLNDSDADSFVPYFLTANHCVATAAVAQTLQATWFYQLENCDSDATDLRVATTFGGADLLATSARDDATLLRLRRRVPPNVFYAGWAARHGRSDEAVVGIHHPAGDVKKYSAGNITEITDSLGVEDAIQLTWSEGVTEGGSSGSGLFRDGYLIGTLSHGDECGSPVYFDFYGSFASFFPRVCAFLDPRGSCGDGHQDVPETAATMAATDERAAAVDEWGDVDYWRLDIPSAGSLIVETIGDTDTVGALENADGRELATDDNSGAGNNFRIRAFVKAGAHFVRVRGAGDATGDYTLRTEHSPLLAADFPNLSLNETHAESIGEPGEVDFYRLTLPAAGLVELSTGGVLDTVGVLRDAAGNTLAADDDSGPERNFRIDRLLPAGVYIVQVTEYGNRVGLYSLEAAYTSPADMPAITEDGSAGDISVTYESDYWRVDAASFGAYTIETTGETDTVGALFVATGERVAVSDDTHEGLNFRIDRLLNRGTYIVRVGAIRPRPGEYTISVYHEAIAEDEILDVDPAGGGTGTIATRWQGAGTIATQWELDVWRFAITSAGFVWVETSGDTDTFGSVEDGAGRGQTSNSGGSGQNFFVGSQLQPGTHYVRVSGERGATGDYTLHVRHEADGANTPNTATVFPFARGVPASIAPVGDIDYWRIEVPTPGTVMAETESAIDTLGALEDSVGRTLVTNDDGGQGRNFRFELPVTPGIYFVRVRGFGSAQGVYKLAVFHTPDAPSIPLFLAASPNRQGFARLVNRSDRAGTVDVYAIDDAGSRFGPVTLAFAPGQTRHFNSDDLQNGNPDKGISAGIGRGVGDWRLQLETDLDVNALGFVRTGRGFLTNMHDLVAPAVAPAREFGTRFVVPIFNPGSNRNQVSKLRLVNPGDEEVAVTIAAFDDRGNEAPEGEVRLDLAAGAARTLSAEELEEGGEGLLGTLGDGAGKWMLTIGASQPIRVMNLLESPGDPGEEDGAETAEDVGNLTNLSSAGIGAGVRRCSSRICEVPLFMAADDPVRQGFVRIGNYSARTGTVSVLAIDDAGQRFGPITISLAVGQVVHFNSNDLENGNADKGLSAGVGDGQGHWRLQMETDLDLLGPLAYVRTTDGFLTSMHDVVRPRGAESLRHVVPIFNPASNVNQVSQLRLINPTDSAAQIVVSAIDDAGNPAPEGDVSFVLPAGHAKLIAAPDLENGQSDLTGRFGDGAGKWRLLLTADRPVRVLNLLQSSTGNLTNLSSSPQG